MKKSLLAIAATFTLAGSSQAALYSISGPIDALQASTNGGFGGGASPGSGTIVGTYDDVSMILNYTVSWTPLSSPVTVIHFHAGVAGATGGPVLNISPPLTSPVSKSPVLTVGQETQLLANGWYVNIHTSGFPGGEIRGQVLTTLIPEPSTSLFGLAALGAFLVRRRRA